MKRLLGSMISSRNKKIACTVSAAALMLGVSSAATIGLHFQCDYYCSANLAYTGYPVTLTAFGIATNAWENLIETPTGYSSCTFTAPGYTMEEIIDSTTSTNGLNPLPNGSIDVTWFANSANFNPFAGYGGGPPPYYQERGGHPGSSMLDTNPATGEELVYATFLRDGINWGPPGGPDNALKAYYYVDVTGLKSLFTNSPFVVELIASSDSMQTLTNAFVIDMVNSITNSVEYTNTAPVAPGFNGAPWYRNIGGGLSTVSAPLNTDHIYIKSNIPQHGTNGTVAGFDNAGTISGFIITDQPVVTMPPQSIPVAAPGDTIVLSAYAIGVPPLAYQWQFNGQNITGATTLTNTIAGATLADSGNYTLIVTNAYGATTSKVSTVTVDHITQSPTATNNIVYDSNPDNPQHDGLNLGASWLASSSDGTVTRDGVMSFVAAETNGISVADSSVFDGPTGTYTFWMQSAGTDTSSSGTFGAATLLCRPVNGSSGDEFALVQLDGSPGNLQFFTPNNGSFLSANGVSNNKWHLVALTFDQSTNGFTDLYIDGALDTTNSNGGSGWTWPAGQALEIGYGSDAYYRNYNGSLDDVRFYNTILSASQISSIYSSGALADATHLQMQFSFTAAPGEGIVLTWLESTAVLQSAPAVNGPWTDLTGASSPYTIVPTASQQFFRYRWTHTPQMVNSNPYLM
jgi:hypothetical protein